MDEQARSGVDERDEEAELGAQLGLEPHVLERQPHGRGDQIDRVRLLGERRIVDERGHPPAAALDRRHGPLRRRRRLLDVPAFGVDPAFAVAEAVDDLERRVVQRVRDGVAERDAGVEREQDPRGAGAVEAAAEDAGEERQRHERERDQEEHPGDRVRPARDLVERDGDRQQRHGDAAREVDGAERPPARDRRPAPAADEGRHDQRQDDDDDDRRDEGHSRGSRMRVDESDSARRAVVAVGRGRLVDEHHEEVADQRGEAPDGDEDRGATREVPVGIGEDQGDERHEREVGEDEPDREQPRVVRLRQRRDEPEVAGRREQRAGDVVGAAPQGHESCRDEGEPGRDREARGQPGTRVVVARDDERGRRRSLDDHKRGREPEAQRPHRQLTRSER